MLSSTGAGEGVDDSAAEVSVLRKVLRLCLWASSLGCESKRREELMSTLNTGEEIPAAGLGR